MNVAPLNPASWFHGREGDHALPLEGSRGLIARIAIVGYLAGFSVMPNEWLHLGWLLIAGCFAFDWTGNTSRLLRWPLDLGSRLVVAFLLWMISRSCLSDAVIQGYAAVETSRGLLGALLLALFSTLMWSLAGDRGSLRQFAWISGLAAGLAALVSIIFISFVLPGHHLGERLQNLLVHGGLNPVCTGLIFGFSALWLAGEVDSVSAIAIRRQIWVVIGFLHFAAFLSGSRGVMLALGLGHAALFLARGWMRGTMALTVFLISGVIYFTSAPLFAHLASWRADESAATITPTLTHHLQKAVERGDNGRFDIYHAGWNATDNIWVGIGQWGVCDLWQCELQPNADAMMSHLHSAFFATFVHGGLIGMSLMLMLVILAWRRALRLARQGDAIWLALLAFGCGGLLFDGESLTSLATAPRFEGLLFWLPVIVALARGGVISPPPEPCGCPLRPQRR